MNKDQFEGQFRELKGKIKEKWGKLTDDDLTKINGNYDQLLGKLQQRYGLTKEKAETELAALFGSAKTGASNLQQNPNAKNQPQRQDKPEKAKR